MSENPLQYRRDVISHSTWTVLATESRGAWSSSSRTRRR